jgi:ribonuclease E
MRRILINATQPEEVRVAIVNGQKLENLEIEQVAFQQKKSNIYKGIITRVEPSLEATFVSYGGERHGFLPFKEIARSYIDTKEKNDRGRLNVKEGIKEGLEVIVQVEKEERGNKGAALTTHISLAGRYLVLMPNNPRAGGVSRRIEGGDRSAIRKEIAEMNIPNGMGTIVRTAGVGRNAEELQWDLDYQVNIWSAIQTAAETKKAPFLIYQESSLIVRALRDNYRSDIGEILVDNPDIFKEAATFIEQYMPHNLRKLKLYDESTPLFNRFQIESQIESAFNREVSLPSGGAIVIDPTEALISIDVNSARATKGSDIEDTATNTNLEAADEVARQLRLRDIGGLVVIDFIDMLSSKNQRLVENRLKEALKMDRARVQIGRISRFGLMEMSRQRIKPALGESSQLICPRCSGAGNIRGIDSLSLSILRIMEDEAMKDNTQSVVAKVPVNVATFLLNEKRGIITESEKRNKVRFLIIPSEALDTPHFEIDRVKSNENEHESNSKNSYDLTEATYDNSTTQEKEKPEAPAKAAVQTQSEAPSKPIPKHVDKAEKEPSLLAKIIAFLFPKKEEEKPKRKNYNNTRRGRNNQYRNGRRARNNNSNQSRNQGAKKEGNDNNRQQGNTNTNNRNKPRNQNNRNQNNPNQNKQNQNNRNQNNPNQNKQNQNNQTDKVVDKDEQKLLEQAKRSNKPRNQNNQKRHNSKPHKQNENKKPTEQSNNNITKETVVAEKPVTTAPNNETKVSKKQLSDYSSNVKSFADNTEKAKPETKAQAPVADKPKAEVKTTEATTEKKVEKPKKKPKAKAKPKTPKKPKADTTSKETKTDDAPKEKKPKPKAKPKAKPKSAKKEKVETPKETVQTEKENTSE